MAKKNILLLCGGGSTEHDISLISAKYLKENLQKIPNLDLFYVEICKDGKRRTEQGELCELRRSGELVIGDKFIQMNFAIPCLHGFPGETGDIQSVFELMGLPYLGAGPEASRLCFNKVSTKLWLDALNIPNTPYLFLSEQQEIDLAQKKLKEWGEVFVKASNQGSSIGCYKVNEAEDLKDKVQKAFELSPYVLIEKSVKARELEVSVYQYGPDVIATHPGEIICPGGFYNYEEKYDSKSHTKTSIKAEGLTQNQVEQIQAHCEKAFKALKIRHLCRMDFFLTQDNKIYLNEINTFPGMTPISMFPKMMIAHGHAFESFLEKIISHS